MTERDLRQEWETPQDFFGVVDREFRFQLDAAATAENAKCEAYYSPEADSLSIRWPWVLPESSHILPTSSRVWLNPGFAKPEPWVQKAYKEAQKHAAAVVVVMALISPSTDWWRDWAMKASEIRLLGGKRVQFKAPPGIKQSSNARENCLIIFRPNPHNLEPNIWTWDWAEKLARKEA